MTKQVSLVEARNNLGTLVDEVAEYKTRVVISKRGREKVVMMSAAEYQRAVVPVEPLLAALRQQAMATGAANLTERAIEAEIQAARRHG